MNARSAEKNLEHLTYFGVNIQVAVLLGKRPCKISWNNEQPSFEGASQWKTCGLPKVSATVVLFFWHWDKQSFQANLTVSSKFPHHSRQEILLTPWDVPFSGLLWTTWKIILRAQEAELEKSICEVVYPEGCQHKRWSARNFLYYIQSLLICIRIIKVTPCSGDKKGLLEVKYLDLIYALWYRFAWAPQNLDKTNTLLSIWQQLFQGHIYTKANLLIYMQHAQ